MKKIIAGLILIALVFTYAPGRFMTETYAAEFSSPYPNVALGKDTVYNSISNTVSGYEPWNIVDGNYNTAYSDANNIILPSIDSMKYVGVDLGKIYDIYAIVVYPRFDVDQSGSRMGWQIFGANKSDYTDKVKLGAKNTSGAHKEPFILMFDEPINYRYILLMKSNFFVISEMEVYGTVHDDNVTIEYSDTQGLENEINLLSALGIAKAAGSGFYGSNLLVKRGEATEYAVKAGNMSEKSGTLKSYYNDVPITHEYAEYIALCRELDIIAQADNFRPEDYITPTEFAKMLLMVMHYGAQLELPGSYPINIYSTANKLDLFKGIRCGYDEGLDKYSMTKMIYNALLAKTWSAVGAKTDALVYARNDTLIEACFGMQLMKGVITGTNKTMLVDGSISMPDNKIEIDSKEYFLKNTASKLHDYIGHCVYFVRDTDEENVFFGWLADDTESVVTVYGSDVKSSSKTELVMYDENDKKHTYKLEGDKYVIRNGTAYDGFTDNALVPKYGYCELIDFDNDNVYEVINMFDPQTLAVAYISIGENDIIIGGKDNEKIEIKGYDMLEVKIDGKVLAEASVPRNSFVYAYVSDNNKVVSLECYTKIVSGTVGAVSGKETVTIDGTEYDFAEHFKDNGSFNNINPGEKISVIVNGKEILYLFESDFINEREYLGCIIWTDSQRRASDNNIIFKIFNNNGEHIEYETAKKVNLDGVQRNRTYIADLIKNNPSYFKNKFVLYKLNGSGEISSMDTENYDEANEPDSDMRLSSRTVGGSGAYYSDAGFSTGLNLVLASDGSEPIFEVACDENGDLVSGKDYEGYYSVGTVSSSVSKNTELNGREYQVYGYDDEKGTGKFLVTKDTYSRSSTEINPLDNNSNATLMVVKNVFNSSDKNGEDAYGIKGYVLGRPTAQLSTLNTDTFIKKAVETSLMIKKYVTDANLTYYGNQFTYMGYVKVGSVGEYAKNISDIKKGDLIRYKTDSSGRISMLELIYSPNDEHYNFNGRLVDAGNLYHKFIAAFRTRKGVIKSVKDGLIVIDTGNNAEDRFLYSNLGGSFVVVDGDKIEVHSPADVPAYCTPGDNVVVSMASGAYKNLILYK